MPAEKTYDKALDALDGLAQIAKNEMLLHGDYITNDVEKPELAAKGAICGGRRACLIGSLWIGYGVKPKIERHAWRFEPIITAHLPGVHQGFREGFMQNRPGLRLAYEILNEVADKRWESIDKDKESPAEEYSGWTIGDAADQFQSSAEALFEATELQRPDVLKLVNDAKRVLRARRRKEHGS